MKRYYESPEKIVAVTKDIQEWAVPLERWEAALDKITSLAWISAEYHAPTSFDWFGEVIDIHPDTFEYPVTDDAMELLAHLHYYGVMTDYLPEVEPQKCPTVSLTARQFRKKEKDAKAAGVPLFRYIFNEPEAADTWGGKRANAGRKKETDQVSARVPLAVLDALKAAADADGVSLSAKTAEILGDWAKKGKGEG